MVDWEHFGPGDPPAGGEAESSADAGDLLSHNIRAQEAEEERHRTAMRRLRAQYRALREGCPHERSHLSAGPSAARWAECLDCGAILNLARRDDAPARTAGPGGDAGIEPAKPATARI